MLLLLFIVTGAGITYFYSDKVEAIVTEALNKQLQRPVNFKNLEFSFFNKFPKASIEISSVEVQGLSSEDEPFIQADQLFLSFDLWTLLGEDIVINEISIENATVNVEVKKDGTVNYQIFKDAESSEKKGVLNLEEVNLLNVKVNYLDAQNSNNLKLHSYNSVVELSLSDQQKIGCSWDGMLTKIQLGNTVYENVPLEAKLIANVADSVASYEMIDGKINKAVVQIQGEYDRISGKNDIRFGLKTSSIENLSPFLATDLRTDLKAITHLGELNVKGRLTDNINKHGKSSALTCNFFLNGARVALKNNQNLSQIALKGKLNWANLNRKSTGKISLESFALHLNNSELTGSGTLSDFNQLKTQLELKGTLEIPELLKGLTEEKVTVQSGKLVFNTRISGSLKKILQTRDWSVVNYIQSAGGIEIQNLSFQMEDTKQVVKEVNGKIAFDKQHILLEKLTGQINSSRFNLNGVLKNYLESILEDKALEISADVSVNQLLLEEFLVSDSRQVSSSETENYHFDLPANLILNLDLKLDAFRFREFAATNIKGQVKLKDKLLQLSNVNFESCKGKNKLNGFVNAQSNDKLLMECRTSIQGMNVKKAFHQLENFGQGFLLERHISGELTTELYVQLVTDKALNINSDLIFVQADLNLKKGRLLNFEPMMELEIFLKDEFGISMPLKDLQFNTLQNVIEISKQTITIPEMRIASNSINMDVAGTHTFDQRINYLFKIKSSQIFKAKNRNAIDAKYGVVDNGDQTSTLPLLMSGTVDNPTFSYDLSTKKQIIKENWKEEGKDVKAALKQEMKELLGKDTVPKKAPKKTTITVVWDEEEGE